MKVSPVSLIILSFIITACNNRANENSLDFQPVQCNYNSLTDSIDLNAYVEAWNSGDTSLIKSLYTANALYYTDDEISALRNNAPFSAEVSNPVFTDRVNDYIGMKLRVIGCPVEIYGKLVAFSFRWENDRFGFSGVSILRFENDKIILQVSFFNYDWTPNQAIDSVYFTSIDLNPLFAAWSAMDPVVARQYYEEDAAILADEDLLKAHWRDFTTPPAIDQVIPFYGDWNPVTLNQPLRIGDLVILAWKWNVFEYPFGYGVRILKYTGNMVEMDVRYGIRPWEAEGLPF